RPHAGAGCRSRRALRGDRLRRQGAQQVHAPLAAPRDGSRDTHPEGPQPHHRHPRRALENMGQKVHPYGFRLGVIKTWNSKWFEDKNYAKWLHEDMRIKRAVKDYLMNA